MGTDALSRTLGGRLEATAWGVTAGVEAYRRYWDTTTYLAGMQYTPQASLPAPRRRRRPLRRAVVPPRRDGHPRRRASVGLRLGLRRSRAGLHRPDLGLPRHARNGAGRRARRREPARPLAGRGGARDLARCGDGGASSRAAGASVLPEADRSPVGNPDLEPSRNTALDLSASLRAGRLYVSASAFVNEVADYVVLAEVGKVNSVPGVMNPKARTSRTSTPASRAARRPPR